MGAKIKNLAPAFARIARLDRLTAANYAKRDAEIARMMREGRRVALSAIKKAGWHRGETMLAYVNGGWSIGIYQGTSISWAPREAGGNWSFRVHTLSVLSSGKPGRKQDSHMVSVDDPALIGDVFKIVGKIAPPKVVRP